MIFFRSLFQQKTKIFPGKFHAILQFFKKAKISTKSQKPAFSLIEIIITITISGIVFSSVLANFFIYIKQQNKIQVIREVNADTHFPLLRISDKIRSFAIDYTKHKVGTDNCPAISKGFKMDVICLENNYRFFLENGVAQMEKDDKISPLTSKNIIVDKLLFFVTPTENPFTKTTERQNRLQPKVTIFISTHSVRLPEITQTMQTTISSRIYDK
jgi:prepilin-type N-terminal cleavage/methylation domain-containing protein